MPHCFLRIGVRQSPDFTGKYRPNCFQRTRNVGIFLSKFCSLIGGRRANYWQQKDQDKLTLKSTNAHEIESLTSKMII